MEKISRFSTIFYFIYYITYFLFYIWTNWSPHNPLHLCKQGTTVPEFTVVEIGFQLAIISLGLSFTYA